MSLVAEHGSSADDAPAGRVGEGPPASSRRRSLGMRTAALVVLVLLSAFLPPVYAPLDVPPYGLDLADLSPFALGVLLVVGGMALWTYRCSGKKSHALEKDVVYTGKEARGAAAFFDAVSLSSGLLVGQAWQTPLPDFTSLPMIFEFLAYRLCALLGVAALLCHQALSRRLRCGEAAASVVKPKGSSGTVLGEMLADLGCINIADQDQSLLEDLSMEAILAADPDKILIVLQGADPEPAKAQLEGEVLSNPAWQQLTAVREGRVYYMDKDLYHLKPNARWGEAYDHLVEILYGV